MRAFHEQRDFKELLLADGEVTRVLSRTDMERAFNLNEQLKHVDHIFSRVFQEHSEVVGAGMARSAGR
jgi:adenylosuccinate lyase